MTEIRFYHLEKQNLDSALPALLTKALEKGHKIIVKTSDAQETERLNTHLWTYNPNTFLPHGSAKDGHAENQPIWLTPENDNPNNADVLILTDGSTHPDMESFSLVCDMFDGGNQNTLNAARQRWKTLKDQGLNITYWQQGTKGWEQKA